MRVIQLTYPACSPSELSCNFGIRKTNNFATVTTWIRSIFGHFSTKYSCTIAINFLRSASDSPLPDLSFSMIAPTLFAFRNRSNSYKNSIKLIQENSIQSIFKFAMRANLPLHSTHNVECIDLELHSVLLVKCGMDVQPIFEYAFYSV